MRELHLDDRLLHRFTTLLQRELGFAYPEQRRSDLVHSLTLIAADLGIANLDELANRLEQGRDHEVFIQRLTIGETYFFRNEPQFRALREVIFPELFARRRPQRALRIWSAGCATGEEPYSLAIVLHELLGAELPQWQISLLATDLNRSFLERAREGLYGSWSFRETTDESRMHFFSQEGPRWRISSQIQRMVSFHELNLASSAYPALTNGTVALDLIVCRNVLIYFDQATTAAVIGRFFGALAPGGWLLVGHAEPRVGMFSAYETINCPGAVLYRKPLDAPLFASAKSAPFPLPAPLPPLRTAPVAAVPPVAPRPRPTPAPVAPPVALPTPPAPRNLVEEARLAANQGDWERAAALVEQQIAADPLNAAAYFLRGQIDEHHQQPAAAIVAYRRSLYLDDRLALAAVAMAEIWRAEGSISEAKRAFRQALRLIEPLSDEAVVPFSEGATAGELRAYLQKQV